MGPSVTRAELKAKDNLWEVGINRDGTTLLLLNGIAQGADFNNRIGRKINMTKLIYNLTLTPDVGVGVANSGNCAQYRLVVVFDRQANGAAPAWSDIFAPGTSDPDYGSVTQLSTNLLNLNWRERFQLLVDKVGQIGPFNILDTAVPQLANDRQVISLKGAKRLSHEVTYSSNLDTIGAIMTGSVYAFLITSGPLSVNDYQVKGGFRIRYTDV